jgi:selenocysteine lyase/cysteine desulfurase
MSPSPLNATSIRTQFPALQANAQFTYGDNAGGSQICQPALSALNDYLIGSNVQMGSDYAPLSTQRCNVLAQDKAALLFGPGVLREEVVFGSSSTQNLENLMRGLEAKWADGDEVIVTGEHEGSFSSSFFQS